MLATLRAARRDAENGDVAAVLARLRDGDVTERTIRLNGRALELTLRTRDPRLSDALLRTTGEALQAGK